jgi:hypothetical protein
MEAGGESDGGEYSLEYLLQSHCDGNNSEEIKKLLACSPSESEACAWDVERLLACSSSESKSCILGSV